MISSVPDNSPAYNQRAVFLIISLKICTGIKTWCNKKKSTKGNEILPIISAHFCQEIILQT